MDCQDDFPKFWLRGEKKKSKKKKLPGWVQKWKGYCVDIICLQSCCFTSGNKVAPRIIINSKANSVLCFSVSETLVIISFFVRTSEAYSSCAFHMFWNRFSEYLCRLKTFGMSELWLVVVLCWGLHWSWNKFIEKKKKKSHQRCTT